MRILLLLILSLTACRSFTGKQRDCADMVNPFIGTGGVIGKGHGNMFPGAAYPFGMIQLSPDNGGQGWEYCAGYHYPDSFIVGFSHTHLSGTGVGDYGDISLMPTIKPIEEKYFIQSDATVAEICKEQAIKSDGFVNRDGHLGPFDKHFLLKYRSKFSHAAEKASPGYYTVNLKDDNIDVELTVNEFTGMHRYRFNNRSDFQHLVLNLGFTLCDQTKDAQVHCLSPELITGYRFSSGKANVHRVYFAMQFSRPVKKHQFFLADSLSDPGFAKGKQLAAVFSFDGKENQELLVKTAISSVSEEGALANLKTSERFGWDFDSLRKATHDKWNSELSKLSVTSTEEEKKTIFYTSLYHSYLAPYRFSDVDGTYKNFNHVPEKAEGYTQYTLLSLWDTFRALNPLLSVMQPKVSDDIIHSMMAKYRQTGELPYWEIAGNEGGSMIGYHAVSLMADAFFKKIGKFDTDLAYKAMIDVSQTDRKGLGFYRQYHFVPTDKDKTGTVSKTVEYSYDDWCIAQVAKLLGKDDDYRKYMERSTYYRNLYDPSYHLLRGKNSDGSWYEPFHPRFAGYGNPHAVEGNTWQYSFFAPHDVPGLIQLMGGKQDFEMMLDSLFNQTSELLGEDTDDVTGLIGQYSQGNEPDHHVAYLYDFIGKPLKTQYVTNKIINTLYTNGPAGLSGNEDCGQMSAWYVFSSIGFYPVNPTDNRYYFGCPQFEKIGITLPNGKLFTVIAKGISKENCFFHSVKLNGKPIDRLFITYDEIEKGGMLEFDMGKQEK